MESSNFIHLHVHSQYSLLDGAIRFEEVFSLAKKYHMNAVALTDHGNMFGAVEFYQKAIQHGIKPIVGCEIYVAPGSRFEKKTGEGEEGSYHLTLLVKNETGYFNLLKLVSLASIEGFYYKPRVDKELLTRYHEGLIALSGCIKGELAVHAAKGETKRAIQAAEEYRKIFGPDRFYIEIQNNGVENQLLLNQRLIEIGRDLSIPLTATNDCHYLHKKDAKAHEVLLCIQTGKTLQEAQRMRFPSEEFYFKSPQEMAALFRDCPDAVVNTLAIAEECNLEIRFGEKHIPRITVPSGETAESYLDKLAREGLERRLARHQGEKDFKERYARYKARLEEELKIIKSMGYAGYFLIVYDFIHYAKSQGIPVGPGRGSAAGSLVAYSLHITDLDPIEYDLIFERFLNPGRKSSMPDVDIDFCVEGREDVIRYVTEKYGKENVAQIITFGKMQAKAVIRDVGRVMGLPYAEVDRIAKLIPKQLDISLDQALQQEASLKEAVAKDARITSLFEIAKALEGLARHASTHAAGVVIANKPLMEYLPLQRGQNGEVMTQYAMKQVEAIGLVKFDFLGLKTLTVVDQAIQMIEKTQGVKVELSEIPLDDPKVYALLGAGSNLGIFQLESSGMRDLLIRLKPQSFKDIVALVALYRPGPLDSGMVGEFIKRRHGQESIRYEFPALEEILKDTYGVIVYQEQVMRIASTLAHFSLEDADNLRRAMAKKDAVQMERQKEKFLEGAKKNRIPVKKAEKIFEQMETFGRYGFNKSHSAAYALLAYQTAYLKTHYAIEFMAALLTSEAQNADKIVKYISECREMKIEILPPDINESAKHFAVIENRIRFGLAAVKNVGDAAIDVILFEREGRGPFRSLFDFCQRVDLRKVNRRVMESLIKCGAFDFSKVYRSRMLTTLAEILDRSQILQKRRGEAQISMFAASLKEEEPYPEIEEFPEKQLIAFEKETIGFYFSRHPLAHYQEVIKRMAQEDSLTLWERPNGSEVKICGLVSGLKEITTKKGDRMAFLTLEDMKGFVEVILFPEVFKASLNFLRSGDPIIIRGILDLSDEQQAKIKGMEVLPLSEASSSPPRTLHIRIPVTSLTSARLEDLKTVILGHQGVCNIRLHFTNGKNGETLIALSDQYTVEPSPAFQTTLMHLFESATLSLE
ncbi:MAG: DNA polymerase III subunit alpha [Deltaproteobacteria bacterium RBG_16_47_11]|nr:MAG: DNA polymerase III subunit alpha [Deltaproteobacteria bacterium RBG_16_47_11]